MVYLIVLGDILFGGYFIISGINHFRHLEMLTGYTQSKGVPMAKEMVILTGLMLVAGGFGILWGSYTELAIFLLVAFLLITSFTMHPFWKESDQGVRMGEEVNFKKNMALVGALLMLLALPLPWMTVSALVVSMMF
ncbi:MAG: DoxX family protein [Candidatus Parcubacteria bacterium]|nr:DoxX family protein [Candidatus Parcubacteria bacterium]